MLRLLRFSSRVALLLLPLGVAHAGGALPVFLDLQPTECPNTFIVPAGLGATDVFPTAVLGTEEFNTRTVQPNSLVLIVPGGGGLEPYETSIYPIETGFADVAAPVADSTYCACTTDGPDGIEDLTATFSAADLVTAIGHCPPNVSCAGQTLQLCMEGLNLDGQTIRGCDCLIILGTVSVEGRTWGRTKSTYR